MLRVSFAAEQNRIRYTILINTELVGSLDKTNDVWEA
jgi:hypothetical protein